MELGLRNFTLQQIVFKERLLRGVVTPVFFFKKKVPNSYDFPNAFFVIFYDYRSHLEYLSTDLVEDIYWP